ncbi:MAG: SIS domain-containing protein [Deltaproteobacteria bacterium]|nr:SIS domain-containing protein [Deltaproteobacteria bacterium]
MSDQNSEKKWLRDYFERYRKSIFSEASWAKLVQLKELFLNTHEQGRKVIFIGNGGSAAMANHCAVDFTKNAGVRCINFNEADLITCFANDFGYEKIFQKALEFYMDKGDAVVLISCSGKSPNVLRAAEFARSKGNTVVTFTGFSMDNPLVNLGDLNLCVESRAYNVIENTHQVWILAVCDLIIGHAEYPPN